MDWAGWLIPVVVVAGVILHGVLQAIQDAKRLQPPPREKPQGTRSRAEVERFLAELNRRRQQQQPPPLPPPLQKPSEVKEVPWALPAAEVPQKPRPLPPPLPAVVRETSAPPKPPSSVPELVPVAREARRRRREPAAPTTTPPPTAANQPAQDMAAALATTPSLKELLRNPQMARTAMMLREIFDAPVSRRRKRPEAD